MSKELSIGKSGNETGLGDPEWVILGMCRLMLRHAPRFMVLASTTLTHAELVTESRFTDIPSMYDFTAYASRRHKMGLECTLTVKFDDYVVIMGPSYQECLHHLFHDWQPETKERAAIEDNRTVRYWTGEDSP